MKVKDIISKLKMKIFAYYIHIPDDISFTREEDMLEIFADCEVKRFWISVGVDNYLHIDIGEKSLNLEENLHVIISNNCHYSWRVQKFEGTSQRFIALLADCHNETVMMQYDLMFGLRLRVGYIYANQDITMALGDLIHNLKYIERELSY